jgi:hypothetical protein
MVEERDVGAEHMSQDDQEQIIDTGAWLDDEKL